MNKQTYSTMSIEQIQLWIAQHVPVNNFRGKRVLMIVPDNTRTAPLPVLFSTIRTMIRPVAKSLDLLVALGTHPPMQLEKLRTMLGIAADDPCDDVGLFNHAWDNPSELTTIGHMTESDTRAITEGCLALDVPVRINRRVLDCDIALIVGPVFPHEVVGFSGGNKYFFPGVAGPELLNFFHWLGALITNVGIIGVQDTAVRNVIDRAASLIPVERHCLAFVVAPNALPYGMFYGSPESAWRDAARLSAEVHIKTHSRPYQLVISCAPEMYDELWVAGKCMYKLEPVVADDGELIIYAPHLRQISVTHGDKIQQIGYHVRDYFTKQWDRFQDIPWGVLAHSTHVRGAGSYENGIEHARVRVTLASQIPAKVCEQICLGYRDPASIDVESFVGREHEGVFVERKAGEHLHRLVEVT